eukprot:10139747-Alexandrium_andersonii.AAC.1
MRAVPSGGLAAGAAARFWFAPGAAWEAPAPFHSVGALACDRLLSPAPCEFMSCAPGLAPS